MLRIHDDNITGLQFSATASFEIPVDGDITVLNRNFRLATTADDADSLEELIERDGT